MKSVIIDCDPGHDDALALLLALSAEELDVLLVTATTGNQTVDKTLRNAMRIVSLTGRRVEVARGAESSLTGNLEPAVINHGETGLDGPDIPEPSFPPSPRTALEAQKAVLESSASPVTMICTAPLTNAAILLSAYPRLKPRIERIVLMGGACFGGNWTPSAEYNIWLDTYAADIVFRSGVPITMCGLDVTLRAQIFDGERERIRSIGSRCGRIAAELLDYFHRSTTPHFLAAPGHVEGAHLHDVCAVAWAMRPDLFVTKSLNVRIETSGRLTSGCTVVDYDGVCRLPPNADVCFDIDRGGFIDMLTEGLRKLP